MHRDNPVCLGNVPPNNGRYCSTVTNSYTPFCSPSELVDKYTVRERRLQHVRHLQFILANRSQVHPSEAEIGVRLVFTYTSPTLRFFTQTDSQYTVMRLAPTS